MGAVKNTTRYLHVALRAMEAYLLAPFPFASHKQVFVGNARCAASGYASLSVLSDTLLHGPSTHAQDASFMGASDGMRPAEPGIPETTICDPRMAQAQAVGTAWFGALGV